MESNLFYESALAFGAIVSALLVIVIGTFQIQWLVVLLLAIAVVAFALHGIFSSYGGGQMWEKQVRRVLIL